MNRNGFTDLHVLWSSLAENDDIHPVVEQQVNTSGLLQVAALILPTFSTDVVAFDESLAHLPRLLVRGNSHEESSPGAYRAAEGGRPRSRPF